MLGLKDFLTSSSWVRLVLSLLLMLYTYSTTYRVSVPRGALFRTLPLILFFRAFVSYWFVEPALYHMTDQVIYTFYMFWIAEYTERYRLARGFAIASTIFVLFQLVVLSLAIQSAAVIVVTELVLFSSVVLLGTQLFHVTQENTENPGVVIVSRQTVITLFLLTRLLVVANDFAGTRIPYLVLPLTYVPHFYLMWRYQEQHEIRSREQHEFSDAYLDSIFAFMETIGTAMTERIEIQRVLDYVVEAVVQTTNAEAGAALLVDEYENVLQVRSVRGFFPPPYPIPEITKRKLAGVEDYFRSTPIAIGETILGEAVESGNPIFIRDSSNDNRMVANTSDDTCYVSSLMAIPLIVEKRVFGVLSVIIRQRELHFAPADFERAKVFAEYASLTLENLYNYVQLLEKQEIEREVGIAAQIQRQLLPSRLPRVRGASVAAFSQPARGVSGDYYDVLRLSRDGRFGLVVCDVAGKGVPASLVMVMIRTIIHLVAGSGRDASTIVGWINRGITGQVDIDRFATLSVITYDPSSRRLEYANAAHHPAIIFRNSSRDCERIDAEGLPIGLEREVCYGKQERRLEPGDLVLLYTDGVVEAMSENREQYGEDRLLDAVRRHAGDAPNKVLSGIRQDIEQFVGRAKQQDDLTLVVMKVSE